jgi:hypothetical protein
MNSTSSAPRGPVRVLRFSGPLGWLLRLLLAVASVIFMISALIVGAVLGTALIIWALLRGRRPAPGLFEAQVHRARRRGAFRPAEVVDIEVREVPEQPRH